MGRPGGSGGRRGGERAKSNKSLVQFRVTAKQKADWESAAKEAGRPNLSSWARHELDRSAAAELEDKDRSLAQLLAELEVDDAREVNCFVVFNAVSGELRHARRSPMAFGAGAGEVPHHREAFMISIGISNDELEILVRAGARNNTTRHFPDLDAAYVLEARLADTVKKHGWWSDYGPVVPVIIERAFEKRPVVSEAVASQFRGLHEVLLAEGTAHDMDEMMALGSVINRLRVVSSTPGAGG